jgi:hypothetical protein
VPRRTVFHLITAFSVGVLISGTGVTSAGAEPKPALMSAAKASVAVVHTATTSPRQILAHWTPERMRAAKSAPVLAEKRSAQPQSHNGPARSAPGFTGSASGITGSAKTPAMAPLADLTQSQVWTAHGQMPASTVGKLYFDEPDGAYECTASVITSANKNLIWTAGHCVTDGAGNWYTNWLFVPDYADGNRPLGSWAATSASAPTGYVDGADQDYDLAALKVVPNGANLADVTGAQGYKFNSGYEWNAYEFGYPYDTHPAQSGITGQQLRYCVATTWRPGFWPVESDQEAIHCDQGHGASGGPWLDDLQLDRGWGYLVGNVSHHLLESSDEERSPYLGDGAVNVYNAQQG